MIFKVYTAKYMKNLHIINYLVLILVLLSGCNSGNAPSNTIKDGSQITKDQTSTIKKLKSGAQSLPYTMGGTYDTTTGYPTAASSCLNAGVAGNFIITNPSAHIDFRERQSLQEVLNALGINIALTIGWGAFSVTTNYNYANSSQDDAYTLNFNYVYKYSGKAIFPSSVNLQGESALTTSAQAVLGLPKQFRTMCGDRFIEQMDAGASILTRIQLHFNSEEDKNYFDSHLKQVKGLDNVLSIIASNPTNINYTLTASGLQVGGNPTLLNNIFTNAGGSVNPNTGYASLNCSTGQGVASSCAGLVKSVIDYTSSIESQLATPSNYYFSNPVTAKWDTIGIQAGDVNPNPATLAALRNVTNLYNQDQRDFRFINDYSLMLTNYNFLSPTTNQNLMNLYSLYQQLLTIYSNPSLNIMDCYEGFVSDECVTINNSLISQRNQIISTNQDLFNFLAYVENNQYSSRLLIGNDINDYAYCGLYPITSSTRALYLLNCNGQVSGSLASNDGISIIPDSSNNTITVNNLNYSYTAESSTQNNFTYQINLPFIQSPSANSTYYGSANVNMNGSNIFSDHKITLFRRSFN